jgi:hypothetical protein
VRNLQIMPLSSKAARVQAFRRTDEIRHKKEDILRVGLLRRKVERDSGIDDVDVLGNAAASASNSIKRSVVIFRHEMRVECERDRRRSERLG